jgi:predicted signal transduction protein with EAL and GGDEF domain
VTSSSCCCPAPRLGPRGRHRRAAAAHHRGAAATAAQRPCRQPVGRHRHCDVPLGRHRLRGLARAAALALERSKTLGRGLYSFYQPGLDQALRQRIDTERELTHALERDEFELFYQPVVDAGNGRVVGCEALLRWQHPQRGLLAPGAFIDARASAG